MGPKNLHEAILAYFAEFGPEVGEAIYSLLQYHGSLRGLLTAMNIHDPGDTTSQYEDLVFYLRDHGTEGLLAMASRRSTPLPKDKGAKPVPLTRNAADPHATRFHQDPSGAVFHPSPTPVELEAPRRLSAAQPDRETRPAPPPQVARPLAELVPDPAPAKPVTTPPIPKASGPAPAGSVPIDPVAEFPRGPLNPAPPPEPGTYDARTPSWDPTKPHDPTGTWPQVERRSGRERRRILRRASVEVVFKNSRYGKDRRSGVERRRNWPKDGHRP